MKIVICIIFVVWATWKVHDVSNRFKMHWTGRNAINFFFFPWASMNEKGNFISVSALAVFYPWISLSLFKETHFSNFWHQFHVSDTIHFHFWQHCPVVVFYFNFLFCFTCKTGKIEGVKMITYHRLSLILKMFNNVHSKFWHMRRTMYSIYYIFIKS